MSASGGVVSVVVPTLNASGLIDACLSSIVAQTYPGSELIVVDGHSSDDTVQRALAYTPKVSLHGPPPPMPGTFSAPDQRNDGAARATGEFVYYVDADMVLPPELIDQCVSLMNEEAADAVIVPERAFGLGFWSSVKAFERSFYSGDNLVEAPRFVRLSVWKALGGLDVSVGGNDDWDFHMRLQKRGYRVARVTFEVLHNEGRLSLGRLARKRFVYGRYVRRFVKKHGLGRAMKHYDPFRRYLTRPDHLVRHPVKTVGLVLMRGVEYGAGAVGMALGPPP